MPKKKKSDDKKNKKDKKDSINKKKDTNDKNSLANKQKQTPQEQSIIQNWRSRPRPEKLPEIPPIGEGKQYKNNNNLKNTSDESEKFEEKLKKIENKISDGPVNNDTIVSKSVKPYVINKSSAKKSFVPPKSIAVKQAETIKEPKGPNNKEIEIKKTDEVNKKNTISKNNEMPALRPKKSRKTLWIILGIIAALIIVGLLIYILFAMNIRDDENDQQIPVENITIIKEDVLINGRSFIFSKRSDSEDAPVIIFLHGGMQSSSIWFEDNFQAEIVKTAIDRGYAVIAPDSGIPLCKDVKQWDYTIDSTDFEFFDGIFNWIWDRQDLNNDDVYVAGISIGGFMASRLAEHYGRNIKAIAVHSGGDADYIWVSPSNNCYIQYDYNKTNIGPEHARTLIIHGTEDEIIPYEIATTYYSDLQKSGVGVKFIPKQGAGHAWINEYNDYILEWFN